MRIEDKLAYFHSTIEVKHRVVRVACHKGVERFKAPLEDLTIEVDWYTLRFEGPTSFVLETKLDGESLHWIRDRLRRAIDKHSTPEMPRALHLHRQLH